MFNNSFRRTYNIAPPTTKRQDNRAAATYMKQSIANTKYTAADDFPDPGIVTDNSVDTPGQLFA